MAAELTYDLFAALLGERFDVSDGTPGAAGDTLTLSEATLASRDPGRPSYSLIFRGSPAAALTQQIWLVRHPAFGEAPIFLVPIGRDAEGMTYQAIFN